MAWRGWPALLLALALAPLVPGDMVGAQGACGPAEGAGTLPTRAAQNDADSGDDAPDASTAALVLPPSAPNAAGDFEAYYWAWLDPPVGVPGADGADWYAAEVTMAGATLMANITSNYTVASAMGYYGDFQLHVYPPGAAPAATTSTGRTLVFDDAAMGVWLFRATTLPGAVCAPPAHAGIGSVLGDAQRNHGLYVGCHPFCLGVAAIT